MPAKILRVMAKRGERVCNMHIRGGEKEIIILKNFQFKRRPSKKQRSFKKLG